MISWLMLAAEAAEEKSSHTPFYVAGGALAAFAVVISFIGIKRHENWPSEGTAKGIMALAAVLVVAACATAVVTSG